MVHLWAPPFASAELRRRLLRRAASLDELAELLEREGAAEADRVAADGVALAQAAGWQAEPLAQRSYGGEGLELARLAEQLRPAVVVAGSRGLSGARAVLGSVSDMVAHYSPVPALIVPHPLLAEERQAAAAGPVVVGYDGSEGARGALAAAAAVFAGRELIAVAVADNSASTAGAEAAGAETIVLDAGRPARGRAGSGRLRSPVSPPSAAPRSSSSAPAGGRRGARSCSEAWRWQCCITPSDPSSPCRARTASPGH